MKFFDLFFCFCFFFFFCFCFFFYFVVDTCGFFCVDNEYFEMNKGRQNSYSFFLIFLQTNKNEQ